MSCHKRGSHDTQTLRQTLYATQRQADYRHISVLKARCHRWDWMEILSGQIVRRAEANIFLQVKYIDGVSSNEDSGNEEEEEEEPGEQRCQLQQILNLKEYHRKIP